VTRVMKFAILAVVVSVTSVVTVVTPAMAASSPVPSIRNVTVSTAKTYVEGRVVFGVTLRNAGSRASAAVPVTVRLSDEGDVQGSVAITGGTLPSVPAKTRRTFRFTGTIPSTVPSDEYHVLVCRVISGNTRCHDGGELLRVTRRAARIELDPGTSVHFGTVLEAATSDARSLTVRNVGQKPTGDVDLDIEGDDDDDFRITGTTCGDLSLDPGASCTVSVVFRPRDDGTREAELEADPDEGTSASVDLVGIGQEKDDDGSPVACSTGTNEGAAPASVLDLTNWKLTLPVDGCDDNEWADEIRQPQLSTFRDPRYFMVNSAGGVVFRARVDGARTSSNTNYARSELREMTDRGEDRASWSNESSADGVHTMNLEAAITATPQNKPHVVAAQVHGSDDDVVMIRLYGNQLVVDADDSDVRLLLDDDYHLGQRFTVNITASSGHIRVTYNGVRTVEYQHSADGMYFKAGCYTLSNTTYDQADQFGEVVIYKLEVTHT
jgi:hypothetical protein